MFTSREVAMVATSSVLGAILAVGGIVLIRAADPVRIAVIDYGQVIGSLGVDTTDAEREELFAAVDVQRRKLSAAGYLVLNGDSVLAVPDAMQVPIPNLPAVSGDEVDPATVEDQE